MAITAENLNVKDQVSAEEWEERVNLAAAYRLIAHWGWDELIFTHLTMRVPGPEKHFLINPYGLMFEEVTASNLVKIDLEGRKVMPSPHPVNPAGFTIHSAIHEASEDNHCVLHIHSLEGAAVSAQEDGLLPITQDALTLWGDIAYHDYEGIALDEGEKARLVADMADKNVLILRNHGLLTVGATVGEAMLRLYNLQRACQMQVMAQAGGNLIHQPTQMGQRVAKQVAGGMGAISQLSWGAMMRKAERLDPGFAS